MRPGDQERKRGMWVKVAIRMLFAGLTMVGVVVGWLRFGPRAATDGGGRVVVGGGLRAGRVEALLDAGRIGQARAEIERAIEAGAGAEAWALLGEVFDREGDLDGAERCWRRAVGLDPRSAPALRGLGRLELRRDRPGEAVGPLERAEEVDPVDFQAPYALALAYRRLGRAEDADRAMRRAAERRRTAGAPRGGMGAMPDPALDMP